MSGKQISLSGEVHISATGVYTTVDALHALKCVGLTYGLYDHAEDIRGARVMLEDGDKPALVVQSDISHHGSPLWETIRVITDDPEQVHRYLAFREVVKMIRQMEIGREHSPMPGTPLPPKKKEAHGRER